MTKGLELYCSFTEESDKRLDTTQTRTAANFGYLSALYETGQITADEYDINLKFLYSMLVG